MAGATVQCFSDTHILELDRYESNKVIIYFCSRKRISLEWPSGPEVESASIISLTDITPCGTYNTCLHMPAVHAGCVVF